MIPVKDYGIPIEIEITPAAVDNAPTVIAQILSNQII